MKQLDIDIVYRKIIGKLKTSGHIDMIPDLENSAAGAATGSEALMDQGTYLLNLKHTNPPVYELIVEQIREYLAYCRQNGLIIR